METKESKMETKQEQLNTPDVKRLVCQLRYSPRQKIACAKVGNNCKSCQYSYSKPWVERTAAMSSTALQIVSILTQMLLAVLLIGAVMHRHGLLTINFK